MGIEFFDDDDDDEDGDNEDATDGDVAEAGAEEPEPEPSTVPEVVEPLPEDDHGLGRSFDEDVEAEVAELLGETGSPAAGEEPDGDRSEDDEQH
jgi:hypothetical protein